MGAVPDRWVDGAAAKLGIVYGEIEAKLLQDMLAEQGIPSFFRCEAITGIAYTPFIAADEPVSIYVPQACLATAREVFGDWQSVWSKGEEEAG